MLNVLGLLDRPTTGRYLLDGVDVAGLPGAAQASLRSCWFGFVFQRFHLLPALTAAENVELGLMYAGVRRQARQHRAREVLARVGLGARFDHRPGALSAGEQQRVAIARAIVRDQRFILADEPTGNLDSRNAAAVLELLESFVDEGIGVVSITHDEAIAARASRWLRLLDGAIVDGAP
jgi:ABC-type lipoprotein export system ATPase subunit